MAKDREFDGGDGGDGEEVVELSRPRDGVALVRLNRPERHNAFNPVVIARLTEIFGALQNDASARAVVLASGGASFSAGADLAWMKAAAGYTEEENLADARALGEMLRRLRALPQATIARVHGTAMGGGVGLVATCDMAIADTAAMFALSEVRLGLLPATISPYVVEAVGVRAARRYFLTGERFDAHEAHRIGLIHGVAAGDGDLDARIDHMIDGVLASGPGAVAASKRLIAEVAHRPASAEVIETTCRRIAERRASDEAREGLAAFFDKRPPAWAPEED